MLNGDVGGLGLALRILCLSRVASVLAAFIPHLSCSSRMKAAWGMSNNVVDGGTGRDGVSFLVEGGVARTFLSSAMVNHSLLFDRCLRAGNTPGAGGERPGRFLVRHFEAITGVVLSADGLVSTTTQRPLCLFPRNGSGELVRLEYDGEGTR